MRQSLYMAAKAVPRSWESRLRQRTGRYVICPFYHAVSDTPIPYISPLYRHRTTAEFIADLDWLQANYEPVSWQQIDQYEQLRKPAFCLTFDDGLREFYTTVAPILQERHIPCV